MLRLLPRSSFALLALSTLALGSGCAATTEEADASQDAIQGSPTEAREKNAAKNESSFLAYYADAYAKAALSEFTALPGGTGLVGAARADFTTLNEACPTSRGFVVSAQRWLGTVPREVPNAIEYLERSMFTVDVYDKAAKKTLDVAIFDESGAFVFGLKYVEATGKYEPGRSADFHKKLMMCR